MQLILGIDCAAQDRNCGIAMGRWGPNAGVKVLDVRTRLDDVLPVLTSWVQAHDPILVSIDAPLGWPTPLGSVLNHHRAGQPVSTPPDMFFQRATDRVVREETNKRPMDVGADRIARAAHRALRLLGDLRESTGAEIPLAWEPGVPGTLSAIEVYPALTLISRGLSEKGYKGREDANRIQRRSLLTGLSGELSIGEHEDVALRSDDAFDAVLCLLAGADFLEKRVLPPLDLSLASKEGWIWFRREARRD